MKWIHVVTGVIGVVVIGAFASLFAFTHVDRYYVSSTNTAHISSVAWTAKANAALK